MNDIEFVKVLNLTIVSLSLRPGILVEEHCTQYVATSRAFLV